MSPTTIPRPCARRCSAYATLRRRVDDEELERAVALFMARHLGAGAVTSPAMFNDLLRLVYDYGINLPAELSTFFRARSSRSTARSRPSLPATRPSTRPSASRASGCRHASPPNPSTTSRARSCSGSRRCCGGSRSSWTACSRRRSATGSAASVSLFADERDVRVVTLLANRFILALAGGAVGIVSVLLISIHGGPGFAGNTSLFRFFGYFGLFCSTVLIMRVLVAVLRDGLN